MRCARPASSVEVISGLTAGIAGPAAIGMPVTDRRYTRGVVLVTGPQQRRRGGPDWGALARCGLTLVIYMGVSRVRAIVDALTAQACPPTRLRPSICSAHTPAQRQAVCTLATLADTMPREGLASPAVVVIGDVVKAAPLWSQTVVAARQRDQASARSIR